MNLPQIDYLLIDLISSCNLNCLHCRASDFDKKYTLSLDILNKILDEAKILGVKSITFSGGEPFLREEIFEMIKSAKEKGFIVRIQTNSLLLDEKKISKLKENNIDWIGTGLDGLEENHDKLRNCKGAFSKVIKNLDLFNKYNLKTHIEFTATTFNCNDLFDVMKICENKKVYDVMTRAVLPSGKGKKFDFALNCNQYKKFIKNLIKLQKGKINLKMVKIQYLFI